MRNIKLQRVEGQNNIGFVPFDKSYEIKEIHRAYLKGFARFMEETAPQEITYYKIRTTTEIGPSGDKKGGEIAVEQGLIDEVTIMMVFQESLEVFKKRDKVAILVNKTCKSNIYRKLKSNKEDLIGYIKMLSRRYSINSSKVISLEEQESKKNLEDYFNFLIYCLKNGLVPMMPEEVKELETI